MVKKTFTLTILLLAVACATESKVEKRIFISDADYIRVIDKNSKQARAYDGFSNTIEIKATILNSEVRESQSLRKATNFQWSESELNENRLKNQQEASSKTEVFLSFFTPQSKDDNMNKPDTVWRLYLDIGGKRYVGQVKKMTDTSSEIQSLYPEHTRWSTPYMAQFSLPTLSTEGQTARLTITGPVGSAQVTFD